MRAFSAAAVLALALLCNASLVSTAGLRGTDADAKNRPVSKVVTLLKDMVTQLQAEADEDEETYEAMGCWCETNDKEKTKAISDAEERIASLSAMIEELTGESARLNTEVKNLAIEVSKNQAALDAATALRVKQKAEFGEEEKDMLQSISSLKSAVTVLKKHNSALLQAKVLDKTTLASLDSVREVLRRHTDLLAEAVPPHQRHQLDALLKVSAKGPSYAPQSGEVFGIIEQMKETFETNLAGSQKDEAENQKAYDDLKSAKETEITAGKNLGETKTDELATADEKKAQSVQDKEDTMENLSADQKFLADLKEKCASIDSEYEERVKTRNMEIQAVSKALEFLTSDEAMDLVSRTLNPTLLQEKSDSSNRQDKVAQILAAAAARHSDPRLSTLAVKARMDNFGKVKEMIQGMVDALNKEKEDDVKQKDYCIDSFNANKRATAVSEREKADLEAKIADLTMTIDTLTKDIATLKAEIAELIVQMKKSGEEREKANKEFQTVVADQRATQKLLAAALDVLKGFYEKGSALVQTRAAAGWKHTAGQAPPPGFKSYSKSNTSGGVMAMIQQIIDDAKAMEADAIKAEETAQITYQTLVQDTNAAVADKTSDIVNKTERKAAAEAEKSEDEMSLDQEESTLEGLVQENLDLERSCNFLLKNFHVRAEARDDEIAALKEAIAMFSGAKFEFLMQKA